MLHAEITQHILGAYFEVYREVGPAFNEPPYSRALAIEIGTRQPTVRLDVPIAIVYRGVSVGSYPLDMVVANKVIVEVKASKALTDADDRQLLTYLKATGMQVGLSSTSVHTASFAGSCIRRKVRAMSPRRPRHPRDAVR